MRRFWTPVAALRGVVACLLSITAAGACEDSSADSPPGADVEAADAADVQTDVESDAPVDWFGGSIELEGFDPRPFEARVALRCQKDALGQIRLNGSDIRGGEVDTISVCFTPSREPEAEPTEEPGEAPRQLDLTSVDDGTDCPPGSARASWTRETELGLWRATGVVSGSVTWTADTDDPSASRCAGSVDVEWTAVGPAEELATARLVDASFDLLAK